jgi:hypothetical protein
VRDILNVAKTLDTAAEKICAALIDKINSRSNIPVYKILRENPMSDYRIDWLVTIDMLNWIVKAIDSTIPILGFLANQILQQSSAKIRRGAGWWISRLGEGANWRGTRGLDDQFLCLEIYMNY